MENGMIKDDVISSADIMMNLMNRVSSDSDDLQTVWKNVVSKIHSNVHENENSEKRIPIGERLSSNTRIIDLKNGVLLIETDHSGWIQYLKFYQRFIITGIKRELPDLKINSFAFRTAGSKAILSEVYEKQIKSAKEEMNKRIDNTEKELEKIYGNEKKKSNDGSNLPPEILEKLESMKKSMLTNSEK